MDNSQEQEQEQESTIEDKEELFSDIATEDSLDLEGDIDDLPL